MNNVNGGDDTMFPLSEDDVVIDRKAIWLKFTHIHFHLYNLGFTLKEVTSFNFFFTIQYIFQLLFTHRLKTSFVNVYQFFTFKICHLKL